MEDRKIARWNASDYPEAAIAVSEEQLEIITKGLKNTVLGTAQAFYRYLLSPSNLHASTRGLFDELVDLDDAKWHKIRQQFTCSPDQFAERMDKASRIIAKDTHFSCYPNVTEGYTLTLPRPIDDSFYNACIDLFSGTRLAKAEQLFPQIVETDEGKRWEDEHSYHFEFVEPDHLCLFANLASLPHIQVSVPELQASRH